MLHNLVENFVIDESNFLFFAMKGYNNPVCLDLDEFHSDLQKIKYIKRLFKRYKNTGDLKVRLILNHIIVFYNMFYTDSATKILFYKIPEEDWKYLKPFLIYLNYMPEFIMNSSKTIFSTDIEIDQNIKNQLNLI